MSFVSRVAALRNELLDAEAALMFAKSNLPEDFLPLVDECVLNPKKKTALIRVVARSSESLTELLTRFPLRERQYLARHEGTPVSRAETALLSVVEAAIPVSGAWLRDSDVLGQAVCWLSEREDLTVQIEAQGAMPFARDTLWAGLTPVTNVRGRTMYRKAIPEVAELATAAAPQVLLQKIVGYLEDVLVTQGAIRRGYAPEDLLTWLVQRKFKTQAEVTRHRVTWTGCGEPARYYSVSVRDSNKQWWHELGKLRQPYRPGQLEDLLWCDLVTDD